MPDARKRLLAVCAVFTLSAISALWMLSARTLDSHECFVSVAAREMLETGDWVFPKLNGQPRINKTPLSYWLVAASAAITGTVDEFTARLPSALFAFFSAVVILYFVNRWLGFRIAVMCTAVWATSLSYIRGSHSARPDMALTFFVMLCFFCFYSAATAPTRRTQVLYMLVFWISLGLGNLAKGPAPLPYVFIPLLVYIVVLRKWSLIGKLLPVAGPAVLLAIALPWPLAVAHRLNWDILLWKQEFLDRLVGSYARGNYPIYYYSGMIFKYVTPWIAFLPMALIAPFYNTWGKKQAVMKFLWLWFVAGLVFLTINAGKRQHYLMPLMPAMAVLVGIVLEDMIFTNEVYSRRFAKNILIAHVVFLTAAAILAPIYVAYAFPNVTVPMAALCAIVIVSLVSVAALFFKKKAVIACSVLFCGIVVWTMVMFAGFSDVADVDRPARDFAEKISRIVPNSNKLVAYNYISARFVQYFGKVVPVIEDKSLLYERYRQGDWVVCVSGYLQELASDERFRKVYCSELLEGAKQDTAGALFHRTAAILEGHQANNLNADSGPPDR